MNGTLHKNEFSLLFEIGNFSKIILNFYGYQLPNPESLPYEKNMNMICFRNTRLNIVYATILCYPERALDLID